MELINIYNKIKKISFIRKIMGWEDLIQFQGDFESWRQADEQCSGYSDDHIFEKVKKAALEVKRGNAKYERDSVLFYEKKYNYPLITYMLQCAIENNGKLKVIDWGGSLGSTFFQNKDILLNSIPDLEYNIIEQEHFVKFGDENLSDKNLKFSKSIEDLTNIKTYNCILLASVLQYLEFYEELIDKLTELDAQYIIVERTPISVEKQIVVEKVSKQIYEANYAMHIFEEIKLLKLFEKKRYILIDDFDDEISSNFVSNGKVCNWHTYIFKKDREVSDE